MGQDRSEPPKSAAAEIEKLRRRIAELEAKQAHLCRLEQSFEAAKLECLGVLAGGIAHDFNNLLMAILGNAELARLALPETSPAHECLGEIEKASNRAAELCRQMLVYSGRAHFTMRTVHLSSLVDETVQVLSGSLPEKVRLETQLGGDLPRVKADPGQVQQVVANLVQNAAESIEAAAGYVRVTTGAARCDTTCLGRSVGGGDLPEGVYAFVEVQDDGRGFGEETKARLFDPFFSTKFTGRGLGLAAVLGVVRAHRGAIEVDSQVGRGSRIRVLLPALAEATAAAAKRGGRPSAGAGARRVLFVDDEPTICKVGVDMLRALGYVASLAEDGAEALRLLGGPERPAFDCVLLDLTMPGMDGETCLRELRRLRDDLKVIVMSGHDERQVATQLDGLAVEAVLQKPFTLARLREALQRAFEA
jgi:signal transduction histidine kinase